MSFLTNYIWYFSFYFVILPTNLSIIIEMNKKTDEKLTQLGLESYYQGLSKGEKGKMLVYIAMYLGISYPSLQGKFTGKQKFTTAELIALQPVITDESWKQ